MELIAWTWISSCTGSLALTSPLRILTARQECAGEKGSWKSNRVAKTDGGL
jgi:hypothetical protein